MFPRPMCDPGEKRFRVSVQDGAKEKLFFLLGNDPGSVSSSQLCWLMSLPAGDFGPFRDEIRSALFGALPIDRHLPEKPYAVAA